MAGRFDPVRDSVTRSPTSEERRSASIEASRISAARKPSRSASIADLLNEDGGDLRSSYGRHGHQSHRQQHYDATAADGDRSYSPAPSYAESGEGEYPSQRPVSSLGQPIGRSSYSQHDDSLHHPGPQRRAMEPSPLMRHRRDASPSSHVHAPSHSIRQERSPSLFHVLNSGHLADDGRRPSSSDSSHGLGAPYNGGLPSSHAALHPPHGTMPSPSLERTSRFGDGREVESHVRTGSLEVQHHAHHAPQHLHHPHHTSQQGRLSMRTSSSTGSVTEFAVPDVPMRSPESMRARIPLPHFAQSPQYGHAQHPQYAYTGGAHSSEHERMHDSYSRSPHSTQYGEPPHHAPHPHSADASMHIDRHAPHPLHISTAAATHSPSPAAQHTPYGAGVVQSPMRFPPTPGGFAQTPGEYTGPQDPYFGRHSSVDPGPPALPPTHHHHSGRYSPSPPHLPRAHPSSMYERTDHHGRYNEHDYSARRAAAEEEATSVGAQRADEEARYAEQERMQADFHRAQEERRYAEQRAEEEFHYVEQREEAARRYAEQREEEERRYAEQERLQAAEGAQRRAADLQRRTSPPPLKKKKSSVIKEKPFVVREEPVELPAPKFRPAKKEVGKDDGVKSSPEVKEPEAITIGGTLDNGARGKQKGKVIELPTPPPPTLAIVPTGKRKVKEQKTVAEREIKSASVDALDGPAEPGQRSAAPSSPQLPPYMPTVRVSVAGIVRVPITTADLERVGSQIRNPLRQLWRDQHPGQSDGWKEVFTSFDAAQRKSQAANATQLAALTVKKRKRATNEPSVEAVGEPATQTNGSLVAAHYNNRKDTGLDARKLSPILPLRDFNNWVKSVLIKYYGRRGGRVFDIGGGKGGDLGKWDNAGVREWILADIAAVSVDHARQRYQEQRRNFTAEFFAMDCFGEPLADHIPRHILDPMFDNVSLQFCLHYGWDTVPKARLMLENVSRYLRPGGSFIGTIPDCDTLRARLELAMKVDPSARSFGNSFYKVTFDLEELALPVRFRPFGERYTFNLLDAVEDVPEYVVDWHELESMAKQNGLTCVYKRTFEQAWLNEGCTPGQLRNMLRNKMRIPANADIDIPMDADLWEAVTLYTAFAFEKFAAE